MERGKRREVEFYMIDLLTIISRLQQEKRDKHIEPDHIEKYKKHKFDSPGMVPWSW